VGGSEKLNCQPLLGAPSNLSQPGTLLTDHHNFLPGLDLDRGPSINLRLLYVDSERNVQLVIERKSISSPADYAQRHSNDHFVSDLFEEELKDLALDDLYLGAWQK
jgi:hypothetical protein